MKQMKKIQQGFTLIELMIVVAIIGILAAIALPAYQDYTIRSEMTEALVIGSAAKTSVSEFYLSEGEMPADAGEAGMDTTAANYATDVVSTMAYSFTSTTVGEIEVEIKAIGGDTVLGQSFTLTGTGSAQGVNWDCDTVDIDTKYLPAECR